MTRQRSIVVSLLGAAALTVLLLKGVAWSDEGEGMQPRVELLDKEWVDAIPAFGAAMSSDDLDRQMHWLHKHNAAHPVVSSAAEKSTPKLDIVEPDGSALQPVNEAAVQYMQNVVNHASDAEAKVRAHARLGLGL